jgi:hypothetical protein
MTSIVPTFSHVTLFCLFFVPLFHKTRSVSFGPEMSRSVAVEARVCGGVWAGQSPFRVTPPQRASEGFYR